MKPAQQQTFAKKSSKKSTKRKASFDERESIMKIKSKGLEIDIQPLPAPIAAKLPSTKPLVVGEEKAIKNTKKRRSDKAIDKRISESKTVTPAGYIPLSVAGPTKFGVTPLNKFTKAAHSYSHHSAANFKQEMLYGNRIKRESSDRLKVVKEKRRFSN